MPKRIALFLVPVAFLFTGATCISFSGGGSSSGSDGGVFKTVDAGDRWEGKAAIPSVSGQPRSMASVNVLAMATDPQDVNAFVIGTRENGIFYSFDSGETWQQVTGGLSKLGVNAVAIDPRDKCTIIAAISGGRIVRSTDCFRSFEEVYRDAAEPQAQITDLKIDFNNTNRIFAGTTRGVLLRSDTAGRTWSVAWNFGRENANNNPMRVVMNPRDSREMYVALSNVGVWRSNDGGTTWTDLTQKIKSIPKVESYPLDFRAIAISPAAPRTVILLDGQFGMLRTTDGGETWNPVKLLTEPGNVTLQALGVSPQSEKIIYYGTASTFYRTIDGGVTWETNRMPTTRVPSVIMVDGKDAKKVYMGVVKAK